MTTGYSTITPEQAKRDIAQLKKASRKLMSSRAQAVKFLINAGIVSKDGKSLVPELR